jgi:hypothetical protein
MPNPIAVLPLDVTGLSPNNRVLGEHHSPAPGTRRMIIPRYGAFYKDDFRIFDPATDTDLLESQFTFVDLWEEASTRSGKAVFHAMIVTDPLAAAELAIDYQAYGGPNSRNANELVQWLADRRNESTGVVDWSVIKDIPKYFKPAAHLHLLAHVYGWERVTAALGDVKTAIEIGSSASWDEANRNIDAGLDALRFNSTVVVDNVVLDKFNEWKSTMSLFQFGLDLMRNYVLANEHAGAAAGGAFVSPSYEDDRYVNLRGLGMFATSLVTRVVESSSTNLGEEFGQIEDPQRGSIYVARHGTVFTLPSPRLAAKTIKASEGMYPVGYPLDDQFIITKLVGDTAGTGCFLKGINARTGEMYLGILTAARCASPLTWHRYYFQSDSLDLKQLVEDHVKANNNPHDVTKDDIKLEKLENLPVVTVDDILSRTSTRKLVTMDALMYHMRAHMEGIELVRGDDGLVDLENNPMDDAKIIFAPCSDDGSGYGPDGTKYPNKDTFLSSFCDGTDKYVRWADGKGGHVDRLAQSDSDDCKYFNVPKQGEKISEACEGYDKVVLYADGKGGSNREVIKANDPDCGYVENPKAGTQIATFCSGVNQMVRYADGHGGYYDMPSMINTYICGGTIYPTPPGTGGTPDPSETPAPGSVTMEYATSHTTITPGTVETITATLRGAQPNTEYEIEFWIDSTAVGGKQSAGKVMVTTDAQGTAIEILQVTDDGQIPRGVYTSWVECAEFEAVSNTIDRTFTGGTSPGTPTLLYATNRTTISMGQTETITVTLTGAAPNTTYQLTYWLTSAALPPPQTRPAGTVSITTNSQGTATHVINNPADDGVSTPRGSYESWAEIASIPVTAPKVVRTFVANTTPATIVYATTRTTIYPGDTETITATLTGAAPNTTYQIEYWLFSSSLPAPQTRSAGIVSLTTNAQGTGTNTINNPPDDGVGVPRGVYQCWVTVPSLSIESVKVTRTFMASPTQAPTPAPTPAPVNANITYSTSHTTISPGIAETITATITNAAPNTTYPIEFWFTSTAVPPPQTRAAGTATITTNQLGNGSFVLNNPPDDGVSTPRGVYISWVVATSLNKVSPSVSRSFIGTPAPTPAPLNPVLTYSSTHSTISAGVTETISATLSGAAPNTTYAIELWLYSPALPSPQTRKTTTVSITTNASGYGIYSVNSYDDGVSLPRGAYTCWAVAPAFNNLQSAQFVRTFVGTPAPTPAPYNPVIQYYSSHTTITPGVTETQYVRLTGFSPNTTYVVECWIETTANLTAFGFYPNAQGITRAVGSTLNLTTNASGAASTQFSIYDNGVTPRGAYVCFAIAPQVGVRSPNFTRYFA